MCHIHIYEQFNSCDITAVIRSEERGGLHDFVRAAWRDIYENTAKAISKLENLRDGFGVKNENELPFSSMIPILTALIKEIESRINKVDCYKKLSVWYWSYV